jgi:hypothetical protein
MRRRPLLLGAGLLALVGVAGASYLWATYPRSGVTRGNFERIHDGMTLSEVEALLGEPPTTLDRVDIDCELSRDGFVKPPRLLQFQTAVWRSRGLCIQVKCDFDGRVWERDLSGEEEGFVQTFLRLLPW